MSAQRRTVEADILALICAVMDVAVADMPGKTTPRTKPRLLWARNMAAFVLHDLGFSDGAIAKTCGSIHRITIMMRRRRMAEKLETTQRYRDCHSAILARLAELPVQAQPECGSAVPSRGASPVAASLSC